MNWVLITITLIIVTVFLLELWTVLRRVPLNSETLSINRSLPVAINEAPPPLCHSSPQTTTTITSITTPILTNREEELGGGEAVIEEPGERRETREEQIKRKLRKIVSRFDRSNVNLEDMLKLGRETAREFEESELVIYEPYIAELIKEKCKSWPILTQLALYRHGKKAKQMLIEEKRQGILQ